MLALASLAAVSFMVTPLCTGNRMHTLRHRSGVHCMADEAEAVAAPVDTTLATGDLKGVVEPTGAAPRSLSLEQEIDELYMTLELYDQRMLELEAQMGEQNYAAEVAVQRTGAFWISRLAIAKGKANEFAAAEARAEAAEAKAAEAEAKLSAAEEQAVKAEARATAAEAAAEATSKQLADAIPQLLSLVDSLAAPAPAPAPEVKVEVKTEDKAEAKAAEVKDATAPVEPVAKAAVKTKVEKTEEKKEEKVVAKPAPKAKTAVKEKSADKEEEKKEVKMAPPAPPAIELTNDNEPSMETKYVANEAKNAEGVDGGFGHVAQV